MKTKSWKNCTFDELCAMERDNVEIGDWSIATDSYSIWITEHPVGSSPKQSIALSRETFDGLLAEYLKERELKKGPQ